MRPSCSACRLVHASDRSGRMIERRVLVRGAFAACITLLTATGAAAQSTIRMVSRERLLREVAVARRLRAEEQRMTDLLQQQVDRTKVALAEEEAEIAGLRGTASQEALQTRIQDFDRRMRRARQITQARAAELQKGFQEARAAVVADIPRVMERLRVEAGAVVLLNADQVLAAAPGLDLTDRAVELFDEIASEPAIPRIDLTLPVSELVTPETQVDPKVPE